MTSLFIKTILHNRNEEITMGELRGLLNIAEKLESQLASVGITTINQLKEIGSREAWLRIYACDPSICVVRLYAFEGAIQGIPLDKLDDDTKASLKEFCKHHKICTNQS
jgi:DNA transformation protein